MAHTLVQLFSDKDMEKPYVKKRLKEFDDKVAANLAKMRFLLMLEILHKDDTSMPMISTVHICHTIRRPKCQR